MWSQLLTWSGREFGHLPWRQNRTLYRTLVSEIMLQQTTVSTVLQHYERFLKQFPDLQSLAQASEEEMLIAWKGLGYYRRAKNLKKIAELIVAEWDGEFPERSDDLMMIKGIGPYTANALIAIGMDRPALAVDANLERVLARIYGLTTAKGPRLQKQIQQLFLEKKLVPDRHHSFRALNEALMDLGRTICQANRAACEICTMKKTCQAFAQGKALAYPAGSDKVAKKAQQHELHLLRVVVRDGDNILAYQKQAGEWLEGQWELPTFIISSTDSKLTQYPAITSSINLTNLRKVKTFITKYSIFNYIQEVDFKAWNSSTFPRPMIWKDWGDKNSNLSTASLKCLRNLTE